MHELLTASAALALFFLAALALGRALAPRIGDMPAFFATALLLFSTAALLPWQVWVPGLLLLVIGLPPLSTHLQRRDQRRRDETRRLIRELERFADDPSHEFRARVRARDTAFDLRRRTHDWADWP